MTQSSLYLRSRLRESQLCITTQRSYSPARQNTDRQKHTTTHIDNNNNDDTASSVGAAASWEHLSRLEVLQVFLTLRRRTRRSLLQDAKTHTHTYTHRNEKPTKAAEWLTAVCAAVFLNPAAPAGGAENCSCSSSCLGHASLNSSRPPAVM